MRRVFNKKSEDEHNFWMSYTDLMSGFLIVFIIASLIAYSDSLLSGKSSGRLL